MAPTLLTSAEDIFRKDDNFAGYKNIIAEFPHGSRLISTREHPDGKEKVYLLKCAQFEDGCVLVQGELNAMSEIYATAPGFIPKPYTWGTCHLDDTKVHFFISEFIDFSGKLPEPDRLCRKLVDLHQTSVSPTAKFRFHVTTCQGRTAQSIPWEKLDLGLDAETNGPWKNFEILAPRCIEAVVPRLIGALERGGCKVKPRLIHGDLWEGNTGTSLETGDIYIFDSAAIYAHNEMEIGNWRCRYNNIHDPVYTQTYLVLVPPSDPYEEWDDRNRLYSVYYNVIYSVNHRYQGTAVRQTAYDDLYYLINKYSPFDEGAGPPLLASNERVKLPGERDHTRA
ncbi:hypothetical protein BDV34DRAFT_208871 [Aspergillus parasiticus]|uniref:protein-ribulosamine 3-kinase n=1 Tax=Aspergillus parasiticus TaxID=5067 RepID=A0A5N6E0Y0_ASPPA|nr:hypothetical protein BDV34DRAFT_208871 [Aspergillus parasiticus]